MKPVRSAGLLASGKVAQALLSLGYLALAARALGPREFGVLILIHSLMLAVAMIARFQTWQVFVHYGAKAQQVNDIPRLHRLLKFSLVLDGMSAVGAFVVVILLTDLAVGLLSIDGELVDTIRLYSMVVLFMVMNGTPNGILQLYDRFDLIAWHTVVAPLVRFLGTLYLFFVQVELIWFLAVWFVGEVIAAMVLTVFAAREMSRRNLWSGITERSGSVTRPEPGIWGYSWGTSLSATLDLSTTHLPVLFTGWLLGPAASGVFRIARQFAGIIMKPSTKVLARAIFPDLARLSAQDAVEERTVMMARTSLLAAAAAAMVFVVLIMLGEPLIVFTAGVEYRTAYVTMLWLAAAGLIGAASFALEPLMIASGAIARNVYVRLFVTVVYIPALYWLLQLYEVDGAGMAAVVHAALSALLLLWTGRHLLRRAVPS